MLIKKSIVVSVFLSVSYASLFDGLLDDYKTSTNQKNENQLNDQNEKLFENLMIIINRIDDLEKNIPNKIEEYINNKLESLEQHMFKKLDALVKVTGDKRDINQKLDALQMDLNENSAIFKINTQKLNVIETKISELDPVVMYAKLDEKIMQVEENFNNRLVKMILDIKENIEDKLDSSVEKAPENSEANINITLHEIMKSIPINFYKVNNTLGQIIKELDEDNKKENHIQLEKSYGVRACKKRVVRGYDFKPIRMDNETLNYATFESDGDGLTYFEINLAIKSDGMVMISLSPMPNPGWLDDYFAIGVGDTHRLTWIRMVQPKANYGESVNLYDVLQKVQTPNILSPTKFKAFYVKIYNQTLEFGEKGTKAPILNHTDVRFTTIKYIGFTSWGENYDTTYYYDCPADIEGHMIDDLEDNTEKQNINSTWSELDNTKTIPDIEENSEKETSTNMWSGLVNTSKMPDIEENMSEERYDRMLSELEKMVPDTEEKNDSTTWFTLENMLSDTQENMEYKLNSSEEKIPENLKDILDFQSEAIMKNNLSKINDFDAVNELTENIKDLNEKDTKKDIQLDKPRTVQDCKKRVVRGYDFKPIRMDNKTLNYAIIESDGDSLKHFEINLAIKSDGMVMIPLSSVPNPGQHDDYFAIGVGDGHIFSWIRMVQSVSDYDDSVYLNNKLQNALTPDILSPEKFKTFYVKIFNQTLEFGEKGTNEPILKYTGDNVKTLKYIGFTSWGDYYDTTYYYDCPTDIEGTFY